MESLRTLWVWGLIVALLLGARWDASAGGLNPEILVSSGLGQAADPELTLDALDNAYAVFSESGEVRLFVPTLAPGGFVVAGGTPAAGKPAVQVGFNGLATVVYEFDSTTGLDVLFRENPGGVFQGAQDLGQTADPNRDPRVSLSSDLVFRHAVWVREDAALGDTVRASFDLGPPMDVAAGVAPDCVAHPGGAISVVYERAGDLWFRDGTAGALNPEIQVTATAAVESGARIAIDGGGIAYIAFERDGDVFLTLADGMGGFEAPVNVSSSGIASAPQLNVSAGGGVRILYLQGGDVWLASGVGTFFTPADNLTQTPDVEDQARLDIDSLGNVHLLYRRAGEVYYRNNVEPPAAAFTVAPSTGEAPLDVTFTDNSTGVITSWSWDFGDGETSFAQSPEHTYQQTGNYDVTLTVTGPGGTSTFTETSFVQVLSPSNTMRIPDLTVFQGQSDVVIPVLGTHPEPLQGYQVSLSWDPTVIDVVDGIIDDTAVIHEQPELVVITIDPVAPFLTMGLVIDVQTPFDGRTLDPGVDQRMLNLVVNVDGQAPPGSTTVLNLENGLGAFPIFNIFNVNSISALPVLEDGTLTIEPFVLPLPTFFLRGDADRSQMVDLADAIFVLSFLFSMGPDFLCPDSADVNDSGLIDISDAVALLAYLFSQGTPPPYPFPSSGVDPTPDSLGPCS